MSILVGVDGSRQADRALAWALREAALRSTTLTVLTAFRVHELAGPLGRERSVEPEREHARAAVEEALDRVTGQHGPHDVEIDATAVTGRGAADAILRHRGEAELLVVGSRGLGGFPDLLLGSVSHQVAAHADVPVAVIPQHDGEIVDDTDGTRSVVVGVDGSASSVEALHWAAREARLRGAPLSVVYVRRSLRTSSLFDELSGVDADELTSLEQHGSETALDRLDAVLADAGDVSGVEVRRRVESGSPAKVLISDAADETNMLVVGSRGRGGFRGLLLGSVSQQCLHHARGPVVVTPVAD